MASKVLEILIFINLIFILNSAILTMLSNSRIKKYIILFQKLLVVMGFIIGILYIFSEDKFIFISVFVVSWLIDLYYKKQKNNT